MTRVFALAGLIVAAVVLSAVLVVQGGNDDGAYRVRAEFKDLGGVRKDYIVRSVGTKVGTVERIDVTRRDTAIVTLKLDRAAAPVGEGASAEVRPANLLGEKYIDLDRGAITRRWPSGALIPLKSTSRSVELDEILNMLAPDVRARLRILINELGIAMAGRGTDLNDLLRKLPGSLHGARRVLIELEAENAKLGELIQQADLAAGPTDRRRRDVARFVSETSAVLRNVAVKRAGLAETVRNAPSALDQITRSLNKIDTLSQRLRPTAKLLNDAAAPLAATLKELPGFADAAGKPLATAQRVAPDLRRLGLRGSPALARLRPTVRQLSDFARRAGPLSKSIGRAGGLDGVLGILSNWSNTAKHEDGISHYFDFHVSVSERMLIDGIERLTSAPASTTKQSTHHARGKGLLGQLPLVHPSDAKRKQPLLPSIDAGKLIPKLQLPRIGGAPRSDSGNDARSMQLLLDYILR